MTLKKNKGKHSKLHTRVTSTVQSIQIRALRQELPLRSCCVIQHNASTDRVGDTQITSGHRIIRKVVVKLPRARHKDTLRRADVQLHSFIRHQLKWSTLHTGLGKSSGSAHFLEGWKGTIAVLDLLENIKSLVSTANRTAHRTAHSLLTIPTGLSHNLTSSEV